MNYRYPLVDLKREYDEVGEEIIEEIRQIMKSADFILGDSVASFENQYADFCGVKHCIGVGSGTAALYISLLCYDIDKGDDVIIPAFTFKATAWAVAMTGARPVLADVEYDTANMDVNMLEKYLTPATRAIMPVHMYGHPVDMDGIMQFARQHNLIVLEDSCEAQGALYKDRRTSSMGNCGAFSFYPSKNLGCYGDGGAIVTSDDKMAEMAKAIRAYGGGKLKGVNSRLSSIQAGVLRIKFKRLEQWNERRRQIADSYRKHLKDLPLQLPPHRDYASPVYYLFVIKLKEREALRNYLLERGIEARVHFAPPIHLMENFPHNHSCRKGDFPVAERLAEEVLSLPIHPFMKDGEVAEICDNIRNFFKK